MPYRHFAPARRARAASVSISRHFSLSKIRPSNVVGNVKDVKGLLVTRPVECKKGCSVFEISTVETKATILQPDVDVGAKIVKRNVLEFSPTLEQWQHKSNSAQCALADLSHQFRQYKNFASAQGLSIGAFKNGLLGRVQGSQISSNKLGNPYLNHHRQIWSCTRSQEIQNVSTRDFKFMFTVMKRDFHATGISHMAMRDFYEVIGVSKGASQSEIKKAYYALAKKYHPDINKGDADSEKKFQEIQNAYEVLKDDEKRAMYDQMGPDGYERATAGGEPGGSGGFGFGFENVVENIFTGGFGDVFGNLFGGGGRSRTKNDVQVNLTLSFMESAKGCTKKVHFQSTVRCDACYGSGMPPGVKPQTCKTCGGTGMAYIRNQMTIMGSTCSTCMGSGQIVKEHCKPCKGTGTIKKPKEVTVDVPAGVDNGVSIKVSGEGGEGPRGSRPGDLIVNVYVSPDSVFKREGMDIYVDATINVAQAILGGTIQVPTLTGDVVLKVPAGTQPGQKLVMRGKGIASSLKYAEQRSVGDQYVNLRIHIPTSLTRRQRLLIEEFAREEVETEGNTAAAGSG